METNSFPARVVGGKPTPVLLENILRNLSKWFLGLSVGFFTLLKGTILLLNCELLCSGISTLYLKH